jgi:hypothetical protein
LIDHKTIPSRNSYFEKYVDYFYLDKSIMTLQMKKYNAYFVLKYITWIFFVNPLTKVIIIEWNLKKNARNIHSPKNVHKDNWENRVSIKIVLCAHYYFDAK